MVNTNAQQWLNEKYPTEEDKKKVTKLDFTNENLEGDLDLADFTSLETIYLSHYMDENQIKNKKEGVSITKFKDAQEYLGKYLNENYPGKQISEIESLSFDDTNLEGELDLSGFTNLTRLDCDNNKLTNLKVSDCSKLKILYCQFSRLTDLDLSGLTELESLYCQGNQLGNIKYPLNSEKLVTLHIINNNFEQNLNIFSQFTSLQSLYIGNNDKEKIEKDIYNRFSGSLEALKGLNKLTELNISNTDINEGLELLPKNVGTLSCDVESDISDFNPKVAKIREQLVPCDNDINVWREWNERGIDSQEIKKWVDLGVKTNEW